MSDHDEEQVLEDNVARLPFNAERPVLTEGQRHNAQQKHDAENQRRLTALEWLRRRQDGLDWLWPRAKSDKRRRAIRQAFDVYHEAMKFFGDGWNPSAKSWSGDK